MKVLLIDNYDSFTYNLLHAVKDAVGDVYVDIIRNDRLEGVDAESYDKIIISPGPGIPDEAGGLTDFIKEWSAKKPMLGVCLGHHAVAEVFGAKLFNSEKVYHGICSEIRIIAGSYIFSGLKEVTDVGRYHSWLVSKDEFPACLEITAVDEAGNIMALSHRKYDVHGVQFHPESVMTPEGVKIISNFLCK